MFPRIQAAGSCSDSPDAIHVGLEEVASRPAAPAGLRRHDSDEATLCSPSDTEALLQKSPVTPVPKLQLATLCLVRLVDPISFTQV
jgi:hypothetical protein